MTPKFSRRHLFARLGAGLAGLWACLRGSAPAATKPLAPAVVPPPPPEEMIVSTDSFCSSEETLVSIYTYDGAGRVIAARHPSTQPSRLSSLPPGHRKRPRRKEGDADLPPDEA
jgi:hypothetical protein